MKCMNKVMTCDDEVFIRNILTVNFPWKKYDLKVESVEVNGIDGFKSFCVNPVDIIITDIRMPLMSGIEMSRKIREIDKRVEIIFLTSYDEFEYARSAIEVSACDYVLKPIRDDELGRALRKAVARLKEKDGIVTTESIKQPRDEETRASGQVINEINDYVERNLNKRLTIKEVAEFFSYTPNYLGRIYSEAMGMHFGEYVIKRKMETAAKMLRVQHNQIGDVARALGYEHMTHFIRHFKSYWGVTPNIYKNSDKDK